MKLILSCFICLSVATLIPVTLYSQTEGSSDLSIPCEVINGDTILTSWIPSAVVEGERDKKYRNTNKYRVTLRRVKKVYPYALLASDLYQDYMGKVNGFDSKRQKRQYLKGEEEKLKAEFEGQVRNITIKEGIILVKLIDRQTAHTGYEVLKEVRGGGSAFLWQGIARIFSSSLKHQYDPSGEDWMIEEIVNRILSGEIEIEDLTQN